MNRVTTNIADGLYGQVYDESLPRLVPRHGRRVNGRLDVAPPPYVEGQSPPGCDNKDDLARLILSATGGRGYKRPCHISRHPGSDSPRMAVMVRTHLLWFSITAAAVAAAAPGVLAARAEGVGEELPAQAITVERVQEALRRLDEAEGPDEATRTAAREQYQQALAELESAKGWAAKAERFARMAAVVPEELYQTKADLAALSGPPAPAIPDVALAQLEQALSKKEADLGEMKGLLAELEAEPKRRAARRLEIPKLTAAIRERLTEIDVQLRAADAADPSPVGEAGRAALLARHRALEQELACYENELRAYEMRSELLPLRRDLLAGRIALAAQEIGVWREALNRKRHRETEAQLRLARREADRAHPLFGELAEANARLAERRQELARLIAATATQLDETNGKLAVLRDQFKRTREKVEAVGLTNAIGLLLRRQRDALPKLADHRRDIRAREPAIRECQLELLELDDHRSKLAKLDEQVEKELQSMGSAAGGSGREELRETVREFLESKKDYLDALIADANTYFDRLVDLDNAQRQLIEESEEYAAFINERVLWIRSASTLSMDDVRQAGGALVWLADPRGWIEAARVLALDAAANPLFPAIGLLCFAGLLHGGRRAREKLRELGETARRHGSFRQSPTLAAVLLTALTAAVWPALLWYVAWRLGAAGEALEFPRAVAAGLSYVAGVWLVLELVRQGCREDGLFDAHFRWPDSTLAFLRRQAGWAMVTLLPVVFVVVVMDTQANDRWADSLGRLGFVAEMAICAGLARRLLRPASPVYRDVRAALRPAWSNALRLAGYPLAVWVPVALGVMALAGYYYTAQQLALRMATTVDVLLGVILLRSLALRWVLVRRRGLAIEQARQRRAARLAESESGAEGEAASTLPPTDPPEVDLATIDSQTRHLVEYSLAVTGLLAVWFIWVDVLPALGILNRIEVWQTLEPGGAVTLADAVWALLVLATTWIAAKNAPGLLEMAVLQRLPVDAGFRYTVGTVARYLIVLVGTVLGCQAIGLSWVKVQWLVAAISVGLGFGLQEIFANFVSGLIILFERPVRVGDVVTVDDVTGVVSRIRMRATTITNWDRKEFIVPNKEFITGRLLNWTLSDQVNRVLVSVGIAYGSDTELAGQLLLKVAREHPLVLEEPEPLVTFEEFGASSLSFVLRAYLPNMDNRLAVIHDLHTAIDREFRTAGIEIAFPQQDVHVRSIDAGLPLLGIRRPAERPARRDSDDNAPGTEGTRQVA